MSKLKTVTVHAGHNPSGKVACGASDYIDESTEARYITKKVIALLKKSGIKAKNCTVSNGTSQKDVLVKIRDKCEAVKNVDLNVSIHFNAAFHSKSDNKTKGVEVYLTSEAGCKGPVAKKICSNIKALGFANRGVKIRKDLYFLNKTTKPAILVEVCFVDDEDDVKLYKKTKNQIAAAIADAIISYK
jgi:N-acetylmuramoyl-L-alanine amidase